MASEGLELAVGVIEVEAEFEVGVEIVAAWRLEFAASHPASTKSSNKKTRGPQILRIKQQLLRRQHTIRCLSLQCSITRSYRGTCGRISSTFGNREIL
jgi:hypothetical protein